MYGYELTGLLKTGGQGEVWRAIDELGSECAVKVMTIAQGMDAEQSTRERKRFVREIETQKALRHSGIVEVRESGIEADKPWYAMALADGSLRDLLIMNPGGIDELSTVSIFTLVLDAVIFAHREGAVHRDLKPENVLMYSGSPRIADFGLVRRLHSGSSTITLASGLGSMKYAAPEQLDDAHVVTERADIYSLGCILHEMLSGRPLYPFRQLQDAPARFRHIIHKATELDQSKRYASAVEMGRALKLAVENVERLQSPSSRAETLIGAFTDGTATDNDLAALSQVLIQHSDDSQLYLHTLAMIGGTAMKELAIVDPSSFRQIIRALDGLADDRFDWEYTDKLGNFLCAMFRATVEVELRALILNRLLVLAHSHNRYRVRTKFIELAHEAMLDPTYTPVVTEIIRMNPECKEFLRAEFIVSSLPAVVAEELAA